jgi:flagellar biosynthetic protein FliP
VGDLNDLFGPNGPNLQNVSPPVQLALMLGLSTLLPAALMTLTSCARGWRLRTCRRTSS